MIKRRLRQSVVTNWQSVYLYPYVYSKLNSVLIQRLYLRVPSWHVYQSGLKGIYSKSRSLPLRTDCSVIIPFYWVLQQPAEVLSAQTQAHSVPTPSPYSPGHVGPASILLPAPFRPYDLTRLYCRSELQRSDRLVHQPSTVTR